MRFFVMKLKFLADRFKLMNPRKLPRNKDCNASNQDCISNLPDDIICRILSCLPTVDAFRTSVLSKEWEYKWTSIYNIDITDEKRYRSRRKEWGLAFVIFMRRITSRTTNVRKLRLRLVMNYKTSETKSWLSALLRNQIQILHLETPDSSTQLVILGTLLNTTSLRDMVLIGPKFKVPPSNCFTNLTSLSLEDVCICNENSRSDTMVLNFPLLETFKVSKCKWFAVKLVEIYAPAMIKFSSYRIKYYGVPNNYTINIHCDRLAEFASGGDEPENIFVTGSKVVSAKFCNRIDLDVEPMHGGLRITRLLKEFTCTLDELTMYSTVAMAILKSKQGVSLTSIYKLRRLSLKFIGYLDTRGGVHSTSPLLLELLHAVPCLKCLNLSLMYWDDFDFDFEAVESIPSCIISSLEKIEFSVSSKSIPSLLRLAKFLLKTALSLKELIVYDYRSNVLTNFVDYFVKKILAYPTGSTGVTFLVVNPTIIEYGF